jgi:hypothetical protein
MVLPAHSQLSGLSLHEDKRIKAPVRVASIATITLATPGATIDGITMASGDRVLLKNQTAQAENGIYVWTAAASALTRATDADSASDFTLGFLVYVTVGTVNASTVWLMSQTGTITLGSTAITFALMGATGPTGATGATGPQGAASTVAGPPGIITVAGAAPYICIKDRKSSGTNGGTFTSGADQTRTLNLLVANDQNLATLDPVLNRFTLPVGTYRCLISAPAVNVNAHQVLLYSVNAAAVILRGTSENAAAGGGVSVRSIIAERVSLQEPTTFEIRHRCTTTGTTNGFGVASSLGVETYTSVEFWLEAAAPPFFGKTDPNPLLGTLPGRRLAASGHVQHSLNTPPQ